MSIVSATTVHESDRTLLEDAYRHFNQRNIDGVLRLMHPEVDWPNGMEGGRVVGHDAVRAYWTRQWQVLEPHVQPMSLKPGIDGRIVVDVQQVVRDKSGRELVNQRIEHIYTFENGLICAMELGAVRQPGEGER